MTPEQAPADLVERACRARISAQHGDGKPLDDAEWIALRSNIEEKWMAAALADVIPEIRAAALDDASMMFRSKTTARQRLRDEAAYQRAQDTP